MKTTAWITLLLTGFLFCMYLLAPGAARGGQILAPAEVLPQAFLPVAVDGEIHRRHWQPLSDSWQAPGLNGGSWLNYYNDIALAVDAAGNPVVAWSSLTAGEIYLRRWDGQSWVGVGASSASGGGISQTGGGSHQPALAAGRDGRLYAAWVVEVGEHDFYRLYLRMWDGSDWVELGAGSASGSGLRENAEYLGEPQLALAPDGSLYLAWVEAQDTHKIYLLRWDGAAWQEVGDGSARGEGASNTPGFRNTAPRISLAGDGRLYLVWQVNGLSFNGEIYARQWDGRAWSEVGTGSATEGGLSNSYGDSHFPDAAAAPDGSLYICWIEEDHWNDASYLYLQRWDGANWREVGTGSASGQGLAITSPDLPADLAVGADGQPKVAYPSRSQDIYVRCWEDNRWNWCSARTDGRWPINYEPVFGLALALDPLNRPYLLWIEVYAEVTPLFLATYR